MFVVQPSWIMNVLFYDKAMGIAEEDGYANFFLHLFTREKILVNISDGQQTTYVWKSTW